MATVTVVCKLPVGLTLTVGGKNVEINGANKAVIYGSQEGYTEVEKSFWDAWVAENKNKSWYTSQSIFARENAKEAKAMAKDLKSVKTGLEPIVPREKDE